MRVSRPGFRVSFCLIVLWALSSLAPTAPRAGFGQSATSLYIEGRFRADEGKYDEAIKIMDRVIALDAAFARAYVTRGYCKLHKSSSDLPGALADFTKAIELDPESAEARILRGEVLFSQRSYKAALADFERGVALDASYPRALYDRGMARLQTGDLGGAIADLDRHLAAEPDDTWGYIGRADVRRAMNDTLRELADLNKAVQVDPENARARADRGALLAKQGKLAEAKKDLEQAVALDPSTSAYKNRLADVNQKIAAGGTGTGGGGTGTGGGGTGGTGGGAGGVIRPVPDEGPTLPPNATPQEIAQDLLSTFSKRLIYLELKDASDPVLYRVIFQAFDGEHLEVELIWEAASRSFDVSGMTAISHGKDAAGVQRAIQEYRKR